MSDFDEAACRARVEKAHGRCGYAVIDHDGDERPCDRPATGWRWYQDVGDHEDLLDEACDLHANEGGLTIRALLALLDKARAELATHREVAESMTGLWEQERDRANRLEGMVYRLADRRANHEPWHCCCAEGSHAGQADALNRMKARAEAAEDELAEARGAIERVKALHVRVMLPPHHLRGDRADHPGVCSTCWKSDGGFALWPCPTIAALAPADTTGVACCPECRHQLHGSLGFCPNLASDNDCSCTYVAPADTTNEGDEA